MGKGFNAVPHNVVQEAEKIREKLKVTGIVYDLKHEPTIKYDVTVEPTTKYEKVVAKTTFWEEVKKTCTHWMERIEYCTKWITDIQHCIKWETERKPTTEFIRNTKDTTEFIRKTKDTFDYVRKEVPYSIEELVKKALENLVDKNAVPVPRVKFKDEIIQVFELKISCPACKHKFSLGGRKK